MLMPVPRNDVSDGAHAFAAAISKALRRLEEKLGGMEEFQRGLLKTVVDQHVQLCLLVRDGDIRTVPELKAKETEERLHHVSL